MILYFSKNSATEHTFLKPAQLFMVEVENAHHALTVIDAKAVEGSATFFYAKLNYKDSEIITLEQIENLAYARVKSFSRKLILLFIIVIIADLAYTLYTEFHRG